MHWGFPLGYGSWCHGNLASAAAPPSLAFGTGIIFKIAIGGGATLGDYTFSQLDINRLSDLFC